MNKTCLFSMIAVLSAMVAGTCKAQEKKAEAAPLRLWYERPAAGWTEALPVGNGRLGAMIFGGVENERIQFNEESLWTGRPRDYHREGAARYLPQIRKLLFEGKQREAEELAGREFMGRLLNEDTYDDSLQAWLSALQGGMEGVALKGLDGNPAFPNYDDSSWKAMKIPSPDGWRSEGLEGLQGAVWFRTSFNLPREWAGKELVLQLGRIRDEDFTWVNGKKVGSGKGKDNHRRYIIPAADLRPGRNTIAIQVISYFDKGGFTGFASKQENTEDVAAGRMAVYPRGQDVNERKQHMILLDDEPWKYHIQDALPPEFPDYMARYQPFGDLTIRFEGHQDASAYVRELDIDRALARTSYESGGVRFTREYFSSAPDEVIAVHLTASEPGRISFAANLRSPHPQSFTRKIDANTLGLFLDVRDGALKGSCYLRIVASGGAVNVSGGEVSVRNADKVTLYLTAATNFRNFKDTSGNAEEICRGAMDRVSAKEYEAVRDAHIREYRGYFDRFHIRLGENASADLPTGERLKAFSTRDDPALAALYLQYGRYLLISSSRPGTQPANLQGIWNELMQPPWDSKYTTNINVEMNYWPAAVLHLADCEEPLFRMIGELALSGAKTARAHYKCRGWVLHHNTDLWRGTAPVNASNHGIWVGGGAWLCHHLWEHYRYTLDREFLAKTAYPLMKGAALFYVDFLTEDPGTGWLVSAPSNSPELGGLVAGPTMDHQLIRDLFRNCIEAAGLLGVDESFRAVLKEKSARIAPNQKGRYGQLQEWLQDKDDPEEKHRHVSHLWGVFPGNEINWEDTPDLMEAARQSLIFRGDGGTGWSLAWKVNLWARFRDGNHAFDLLEALLRPAITPDGREQGGSYLNLFDAHPPFQIDGNFGGASGIAEMLLQSQHGYIDLLPALPDAWASGEIKGIRARGGFILNFRWEDGRLKELEVNSGAGAPCQLRYGTYEARFPTVKGRTYLLNEKLQEIAR